MKKLRVTIEGKAYDVLVEVIEDAGAGPTAPWSPAAVTVAPPVTAANAVAERPVATSPAKSGAAGDVTSPLAGKVVSIDVEVGQSVEEGRQLAVVEAMKMNTYVFAPRGGRVTAIMVKAGDGVEEGTVVLRLG